MADLNGKLAVITGAGSGMGRASALAFAAAGARVVVVDRDEQGARGVSDEIEAAGGAAEALVLDLADLDAIAAAFASLAERIDRIDVLFNHAGTVCPPGIDVSEQDWERATAVNLRAPIFVTKAALPLLARGERGASLIYTASIAGLVASPMSPLYAAMKGAVVQYMRSVAFALGPEGIRANAICPGPTDTPMLPSFFAPPGLEGAEREAAAEQALSGFLQKVPLRRAGQPEEVAGLALFLASDASSYISGVAIPADGGYVAG
jgi:NAD(P)-dependent dehydrogenase (short-subunit alcohol dehydrogenase family)